MFTAYAVITVITILANAGIAAADFARAEFVLANSAEVGVPRTWLPRLAALKAAGAAGLLLGLVGVPVVGVAAASGLVLFFLGAVAAHIRARVYGNIAFPCGYLVLAAASLALTLAVAVAVARQV
ncbi:DoxX family protein [Streptomyces sp. NPDC056061]|uniref:DoxX family protein n=1 Tax=Streptomyces sp. NPDC056061 TaxID=3345700 RepID=UPI0035DF3E7F